MQKLTHQYLLNVEEYANIKNQGECIEDCLQRDSFRKLWSMIENISAEEKPKLITITPDEASEILDIFCELDATSDIIRENLWIENEQEIADINILERIYLKEHNRKGKKKCVNCNKFNNVKVYQCECGYDFTKSKNNPIKKVKVKSKDNKLTKIAIKKSTKKHQVKS